jgi:hypothetical protein
MAMPCGAAEHWRRIESEVGKGRLLHAVPSLQCYLKSFAASPVAGRRQGLEGGFQWQDRRH